MSWWLGSTVLIAFLNRLGPQAAGYYAVTDTLKMMNLCLYELWRAIVNGRRLRYLRAQERAQKMLPTGKISDL